MDEFKRYAWAVAFGLFGWVFAAKVGVFFAVCAMGILAALTDGESGKYIESVDFFIGYIASQLIGLYFFRLGLIFGKRDLEKQGIH